MVLSCLLSDAFSASAPATRKQGLTIDKVTQFQESGNSQTRLGFVTELLANDRI
jgi:hypothetical protein